MIIFAALVATEEEAKRLQDGLSEDAISVRSSFTVSEPKEIAEAVRLILKRMAEGLASSKG